MKRDPTIDLLKGIGITAVLVGHLPYPMVIINLVYFVHMPLFFFASGYFHKTQTLKVTLLKNKWFFLSYFFYLLIFLLYGFIKKSDIRIDKEMLCQLLLFTPEGILNVPCFLIFWFPTALISLKLIDSTLKNISIGFKLTGSVILYFIISLFLNSESIVNLPFCISQALVLSCFYYFGAFVNEKNLKFKQTAIVSALIFFIGGITYILTNNGLTSKIVNYHFLFTCNPLWSLILAISGIVGLYSLVKLIPGWNFLLNFGEYSYFVMATHLLFFSIAGSLIKRIGSIPIVIDATLIFMITVLIQYIAILLYRKYNLNRYALFSKIIFLR